MKIKIREKETCLESKPVDLIDVLNNKVEFELSDGTIPVNDFLCYQKKYDLISDCDCQYKNQWISVDNGLPEKRGYYLIHYSDGNNEVAEFMSEAKLFIDTFFEVAIGVTHWMTIPEIRT